MDKLYEDSDGIIHDLTGLSIYVWSVYRDGETWLIHIADNDSNISLRYLYSKYRRPLLLFQQCRTDMRLCFTFTPDTGLISHF